MKEEKYQYGIVETADNKLYHVLNNKSKLLNQQTILILCTQSCTVAVMVLFEDETSKQF